MKELQNWYALNLEWELPLIWIEELHIEIWIEMGVTSYVEDMWQHMACDHMLIAYVAPNVNT